MVEDSAGRIDPSGDGPVTDKRLATPVGRRLAGRREELWTSMLGRGWSGSRTPEVEVEDSELSLT